MSSLLQLRNRDVTPPGGWSFFDVETGTKIVAGDPDSLIRLCRQHRKVNGLSIPENFDQVIEDAICRRIPITFVKPRDGNAPIPVEGKTPNQKVQALQRLWKELGCITVERFEAERRARICRYCAMNKIGQCLSCNGVYDWLKQQFNIPELAVDPYLHLCNIDRIYIKPQIHLDSKVFTAQVPSEFASRYPEHCWKRIILEAPKGKQP